MANEFLKFLQHPDVDPKVRVRSGVVSSTSPLEVTIAQQSGLTASRLANYTPGDQDMVLILQIDTDLIVLDQIISGG